MNTTTTPQEENNPCFIKTHKENHILAVETSKREYYQFPYFHFLAGCHAVDPETGKEIYILDFSMHIVRIEGRNLHPLAKAIELMRARLVRLTNKSPGEKDVFIERIDVAYRHAEEQ
jgi:hypothetical protein